MTRRAGRANLWAIRLVKLVIVLPTFAAWFFSFLLFVNGCYENCRLTTAARVLRWPLFAAVSIAAYCAYRVAVTERPSERREGLIFVLGALAAWAVLLGALVLVSPDSPT
jgi:hypothetical protein